MTTATKIIRVEAKLFLRDPVAAFCAIALPALLILVLGLAIPGFREPADVMGGLPPIEVYLPITMALAIATVTMVALLGVVATYRERGVLRRLSTTPVSPPSLLVAQVAVHVVALLVGAGLAWLVAATVFGVPSPRNLPGTLLAFTLGSCTMCALALLVAAVVPTARAASGVGQLVYFPMMFFAGVWTPGSLMPDAVRRIADFTPLGAGSLAVQDAWAGTWPSPLHLAVMAASTVLLGGLAARYFRWE
jgi:ABC-2 type transport system permease protein